MYTAALTRATPCLKTKSSNKTLIYKQNTTNNYFGERGIRTLDTLLTYTRFPGVLLQPLGHLSSETKNIAL
jgi:hypothetical protein